MIYKWFASLDETILVVVISSVTSILLFVIGWGLKWTNDRYLLNYKLKREYLFDQKKQLKQEIAQNKMNVLNAAEKLNHRFWNFSQHPSKLQENDGYYISLFKFRILKLLFFAQRLEVEVKSIDSSVGTKEDQTFLKYIKVFKDILTDKDLFCGFIKPYDPKNVEEETNHQRKNNLEFIVNNFKEIEEDKIILKEFNKFYNRYVDNEYIQFDNLFLDINVKNTYSDSTINVFKSFHIILINFLNHYGLDYQKTDKVKLNKVLRMYRHGMKSTLPFEQYVIKTKLENEFKDILKLLR